MTELKEICKVQCGFAFDSKKFTEDDSFSPLIRIRDVKRGFTQTYYTGEFSSEYIVHKGDLLVGMDGEFNIARWNSEDALLNQRVCRIIANSNVNEDYLRFYLKRALKLIESKTSFVTVKHLSAKELNGLKLNLPCMEDQQRISKQLSILELVIRKNKKVLELFDELVKARFVEMFGDPIENQKDWEVVKIRDIVTDVRYGTSKPAVEGGRYPYLRMNNLTVDGGLDLSDLKYIDIPDNEIEKCVVRKGDILFNRTNSIDLIGKTAIFNLLDDMVIAGYIIRIRLNDQILPDVFSQYMNLETMKKILRGMAKGAVNQANINAQELQSIKVYIPDMELQRQYVEFKEEIDKSRSRIQKSLEASQELFDSLMQDYFG
ncbi:restriction endonuclease subunit S [uncultured Catenibacterium sp.]|uniref:restriction endonuclease subunit S n=1 Tax=uncultured Catenibacterium sp. TaxID=286142 RepID=UPI00258D75DE|nr:restriction endonuclease subunit S [uncultured Catenibacterium sp.]